MSAFQQGISGHSGGSVAGGGSVGGGNVIGRPLRRTDTSTRGVAKKCLSLSARSSCKCFAVNPATRMSPTSGIEIEPLALTTAERERSGSPQTEISSSSPLCMQQDSEDAASLECWLGTVRSWERQISGKSTIPVSTIAKSRSAMGERRDRTENASVRLTRAVLA